MRRPIDDHFNDAIQRDYRDDIIGNIKLFGLLLCALRTAEIIRRLMGFTQRDDTIDIVSQATSWLITYKQGARITITCVGESDQIRF